MTLSAMVIEKEQNRSVQDSILNFSPVGVLVEYHDRIFPTSSATPRDRGSESSALDR